MRNSNHTSLVRASRRSTPHRSASSSTSTRPSPPGTAGASDLTRGESSGPGSTTATLTVSMARVRSNLTSCSVPAAAWTTAFVARPRSSGAGDRPGGRRRGRCRHTRLRQHEHRWGPWHHLGAERPGGLRWPPPLPPFLSTVRSPGGIGFGLKPVPRIRSGRAGSPAAGQEQRSETVGAFVAGGPCGCRVALAVTLRTADVGHGRGSVAESLSQPIGVKSFRARSARSRCPGSWASRRP